MTPAGDVSGPEPGRTGWAGIAAAPPPEGKDAALPDGAAQPGEEQMGRPGGAAAGDEDTAAADNVPLMAWLRAGAGLDGRGSDATDADDTAERAGDAGPATGEPEAVAEPAAKAAPDDVAGPAVAGPGAATDLATDDEAGWPDDPDALAEADAPAEVAAPAGPGVFTEAGVLAEADQPAGGAVTLADLSRAVIINATRGDDGGDQWTDVLTMFVDDPRGSVLEAAAMVDEAIDGFIAVVRERQESLASSWEARGAGTEELRLALQAYRRFWSSLADLRQSA